jgi:hypothetical protein
MTFTPPLHAGPWTGGALDGITTATIRGYPVFHENSKRGGCWLGARRGSTDKGHRRRSRHLMRPIAARMAVFLGAFTAQQLVWQGLRGSFVERLVIHWGTVQPAAILIGLLTPGAHAQAVGFSLVAPGGGLNILNGCEGMEALFLLSAAFSAVPLPIGQRWRGLLLGVVVVFVVDQLRILMLCDRRDHGGGCDRAGARNGAASGSPMNSPWPGMRTLFQ